VEAGALGIGPRVHFVPGGKLAPLLNRAESAVTVNSTAAQQALWRGLPVKAFGAAVYAKPELVSPQPLPVFFAAPRRPDVAAYRSFRLYMLSTSQVRGGFYSAEGRGEALRRVTDMMLRAADPYEALAAPGAAAGQHLRIAQ
jgi:capsular polysaccharide export protein